MSTAARVLPAPGGPFATYHPASGTFDEMCTAAGEVRPHWTHLAQALDQLGSAELEHRWEDARRLLHDNGVTYNVYDDPASAARLWPLDPIPMLVTSAEWSTVEHGLVQRAELLDLLFADLYGPRQLIRRGLLPPELVHTHPGFWRPCDGQPVAGPRRLTLYAADLARGDDGTIYVLGDRTQAPSGTGYALENRAILSRILPSLYRDLHVHRLTLFFRALRTALANLAPQSRDDPHVALLTPGPENETYFEHAFLANQLGSTLVQGSDLTVREGRLWLKTLDGLTPVDVLLRRVDDGYCDPLELRPDSLLGVAGLLEAARLGHVAIANPLGSGVLEHPGLVPFLPAVARELLGEDLRLPAPPTWWCGTADGLAYVLAHLDTLVVKPIAPHPGAPVHVGANLSTGEREALVARIRAQPERFVGQAVVPLGTAPTLVGARVEPRPTVLRGFAVAANGGYVVLPGGLCRVAPRPDTVMVSNQLGGSSKDVWILASEPERDVQLWSAAERPVPVTRAGDEVPGRVADDLFWVGRYAERTEGSVRLLREVVLRLLGSDRAQQDGAVALMLATVTVQTATYPGFVGPDAAVRLRERLRAPETELLSVVLDRTRVGSVRFNIDALVRAGRAVRDQLSSDASRVINAIDQELRRPADLRVAAEALQRIITLLAAFAGICADSMSRGQGWQFLSIGRHLERALTTITLLRNVFIPGSCSVSALEAALAVAHSLKTYRRRYRTRIEGPAVLDLLLLDESNPRSLAYQFVQLEQLVGALAHTDAPRRGPTQRIALDALTRLRLFDVGVVADREPAANPLGPPRIPPGTHALDALLVRLATMLGRLSDELTRQYFTHPEPPQQLVRLA